MGLDGLMGINSSLSVLCTTSSTSPGISCKALRNAWGIVTWKSGDKTTALMVELLLWLEMFLNYFSLTAVFSAPAVIATVQGVTMFPLVSSVTFLSCAFFFKLIAK